MRIPDSLASLLDHGIIEEVIRPLMSGKEAQIYLIVSNGEERVAKVYKEALNRSFKNRADYTEGRKVRNSRDQRAMDKRSRYGRAKDESTWRSTEVDMIYRLRDAGVRVPTPYHFIDGVLIMELVRGADGNPASRLGDLTFTADEANALHRQLLIEVIRMLCAGVVHGDLSDFNILFGTTGPVIIDFPQAVHAANNLNARKLLLRDVANLQRFAQRFVPRFEALPYGQEMWQLYERGELRPDTQLTGAYAASKKKADTAAVFDLIHDAEQDEQQRRGSLKGRKPPSRPHRGATSLAETAVRRDKSAPPAAKPASSQALSMQKQASAPATTAPAKPRRRRRRRKNAPKPS